MVNYIDGDIKKKEDTEQMLQNIHFQYIEIATNSSTFMSKLREEESKELFQQGFWRRLGRVKESIFNIYKIYPFYKYPKLLTERQLRNLEINLESHIINFSGCLDNLALIWNSEKKTTQNKMDVSFFKDKFMSKSKLSDNFKKLLEKYKKNLHSEYLKGFRDGLAHRIPLYIPKTPKSYDHEKTIKAIEKEVNELYKNYSENLDKIGKLHRKQDKLFVTGCYIKHSFIDNSNLIMFHAQIIANWNSIIEIYFNFIKEFEAKSIL
jgi:hypothetical protein